jgi:hypothetical protein
VPAATPASASAGPASAAETGGPSAAASSDATARPGIDPSAAFARAAQQMESASRQVGSASRRDVIGVATSAAATAAPATSGITRESTLDDAAKALASDLRAVPGIERFGTMRLAELERTGPRPLRTMWRIAKDRLDDRYGELTIGEILDRYTGPGGTSASA